MTNDRLEGIEACVFDAYGTLFDFAAAARRCEDDLGERVTALTALWRDKQLHYTWLRAAQGKHADFWQTTGDALDYALEALGIDHPGLRHRLMELFLTLDPFPEVPGVRSVGIRPSWRVRYARASPLIDRWTSARVAQFLDLHGRFIASLPISHADRNLVQRSATSHGRREPLHRSQRAHYNVSCAVGSRRSPALRPAFPFVVLRLTPCDVVNEHSVDTALHVSISASVAVNWQNCRKAVTQSLRPGDVIG